MSAITEFYALRLAPVALVLAACSSPAGAPATSTDAGSPAAVTYGHGRVTVDADGQAFDTALDVPCAFAAAADGATRCLPAQPGVTLVGSMSLDCTDQVASAPEGVTHVFFVEGGNVCASSKKFDTHAVFAAGDAGSCSVETAIPDGNYFRCTSMITPTQFVSVTEADQ